MTTTIEDKVTVSRLHPKRLEVLDPDLPLLASQAALELDNKTLGQQIELRAVKQLASALKNSFASLGTYHRKSLVDPGAVAVLSRALQAARWINQPSTVDELSDTTWQLADKMDQMEDAKTAAELKKIRDFCVELSGYAASYRQASSDAEPVPPYKR